MQTIHSVTEQTRVLDVGGGTLERLTSLDEQTGYCVLKGTLPPGSSVPLHSHPDPESFLVVSGRGQVLTERNGRLDWMDVKTGDFVHIPGGSKHAHRNPSREPLVEMVVTTPPLAQFFEELGRPVEPGTAVRPPTPDDLARLQAVAKRYGHWLATPAENAAVGLSF